MLNLSPATEAHGWRMPDAIQTVLVGEPAVVHDTVGGTIVALDEGGTAAWRALGGDEPIWWKAEMMGSTTTLSFLQRLASIGLLEATQAAKSTQP